MKKLKVTIAHLEEHCDGIVTVLSGVCAADNHTNLNGSSQRGGLPRGGGLAGNG